MNPFHVFLLIIVVAIWGINFVFVKIGLQEIPPLLLCALRFFLVSVPALFFLPRPKVPFRWILLYGLVMFVLQFGLMFSGIQVGVSAGLGSILLQTQVFFSLPFAYWILKEKIDRWKILGALFSFLGVAIVGSRFWSSSSLLGFILVLLAAATWGLGSVIVKKMGKVNSGSLLVWGSTVAWPVLLFLSILFEGGSSVLLQLSQLSYSSYGAVLYIALGSTVLGFGIWNWLVQVYPIATIAPFTLLVPVFGMIGSFFFLGEPIESWKIYAGLLVIGGLCIHLFGSRLFAKGSVATE